MAVKFEFVFAKTKDDEETQLYFAEHHLDGVAKDWWLDIQKNQPVGQPIDTFTKFEKQIKNHFLGHN